MDGIEQILQEEDKNTIQSKGLKRGDSKRQQENSFLSGNEYGGTGTAKKKKEHMSPNPFDVKL